jgi:hypothetical protein
MVDQAVATQQGSKSRVDASRRVFSIEHRAARRQAGTSGVVQQQRQQAEQKSFREIQKASKSILNAERSVQAWLASSCCGRTEKVPASSGPAAQTRC